MSLLQFHDFELFKRGFQWYLNYLTKLPAEHAALYGDQMSCYWALLCNKGYIGPEASSPDVCRFCPVRDPWTHHDRALNILISQARVHVECYFGHFYCLFSIFRNCYYWSHTHFDDDFLICCRLTNESLLRMVLEELDGRFYNSMLEKRVRDFEETERKQKREQEAYCNRRRRCLLFGEQ